MLVLVNMLDDPDPNVVEEVVHALGQTEKGCDIDAFARAASHEAPNVRWAVATALEDHIGDERAERLMLALMRDGDTSVRDRATFAVGSLSDHDTPRIRAALAERLADVEPCVAKEAALGLARRHDARAIPYIASAIETSDDDIEEAADEITSPEMLIDLMKARDVLGEAKGLRALIERCRKRADA
jgi:HEAT repeat protein